jgi:hypothetical protein
MLIFFERGRLGNQLFQYVALRKFYPNDHFVLVGFSDIQALFHVPNTTFISSGCSKITRLLRRNIEKILCFLARRVRLMNCFAEDLSKGSTKPIAQRGLLSKITFCADGYFQSDRYIESFAIQGLEQKADIWAKANGLMQTYCLGAEPNVFMHVRRGDYLSWPSKQNSAVLPASWYFKAIEQIRVVLPKARILILSDDIHYVRDVFSSIDNTVIISENPEWDFPLMSLCDGGILSASSYSWWAARLIKQRLGESCIFIAPKYWAGHRNVEWFPPEIETEWMRFI